MSIGMITKALVAVLVICAIAAFSSVVLPNDYWYFLETVPVKRFLVFIMSVIVTTSAAVLYFIIVSPTPKRFIVTGFWFITPLMASCIFVSSKWPERVQIKWDEHGSKPNFDFQFPTMNGWTVALFAILVFLVLMAWAMYIHVYYRLDRAPPS